MASNTTWLPQLQALLATAPQGTNPFTWYLEKLSESIGGPQVEWAKPIFIIIAVVSFINVLGAIVALTLRYRQDGRLPLYKMRDHRSGGKYICLNTTTVFLCGHILTSLVFGLYVLLHTYYYDVTGRSYQDLSWAVMMWLAPYVVILLTSTGVLYGVLVVPTAMGDIRRTRDDSLLPPQAPLAGLPCWFLNSFIFLAPTAVIVSILVPGIKLVNAVKSSEESAFQAVQSMTTYAALWEQQLAPSTAEQVTFLQVVARLQSSVKQARSLWSPTFGLWSGWVALAGVLSLVAFVAVSRVTKARLVFAQRQYAADFDMTGQYDSGDIFQEKPRQATSSPYISNIVSQARSDYITLSLQFGLAAVLLFVCEVMLLWDTIVGYDVHLKPDLLATAVMVPPIAYYLQASTTLGFIIVCFSKFAEDQMVADDIVQSRGLRSKSSSSSGSPSPSSSPLRPGMLPKFSSAHSRQESEDTLWSAKRSQHISPTRTRGTGRMLLSDMAQAYGVAPSMLHQVEVTRVVEVQTDVASIAEKGSPSPSESRVFGGPAYRERREMGSPDLSFGRAV